MKRIQTVLIAATVAVAASAFAGAASAASVAVTTGTLNQRSGPGTQYGVQVVLPAGARVTVIDCLPGRAWCDVDWQGYRGWVAGAYLSMGGYYAPPPRDYYAPPPPPPPPPPVRTYEYIYRSPQPDLFYNDRPNDFHRRSYDRYRDRGDSYRPRVDRPSVRQSGPLPGQPDGKPPAPGDGKPPKAGDGNPPRPGDGLPPNCHWVNGQIGGQKVCN